MFNIHLFIYVEIDQLFTNSNLLLQSQYTYEGRYYFHKIEGMCKLLIVSHKLFTANSVYTACILLRLKHTNMSRLIFEQFIWEHCLLDSMIIKLFPCNDYCILNACKLMKNICVTLNSKH